MDNVLVIFGFDDAQALSAKAALALKLNGLIDQWFQPGRGSGDHRHELANGVRGPSLQAPEHFA